MFKIAHLSKKSTRSRSETGIAGKVLRRMGTNSELPLKPQPSTQLLNRMCFAPKDNSREAGGKRNSRDNEAQFAELGSDPQRSDARITARGSPPHEFDINPPKTLAVYLRDVCLAGHYHLSTRAIHDRDRAVHVEN
jgi:hypothetical protein